MPATVVVLDRLDTTGVERCREHLLVPITTGQARLVLDLSGLERLDSSGMALLITVLKRARAAGGDVACVQPRRFSVLRQLQLTRLTDVLQVTATREEALARVE